MSSSLCVMKFGGTSVEDAAALRRLVAIVEAAPETRRLVVVSALAGVTDELIALLDAATSRRPQWAERLESLKTRHVQVAQELELLAGPAISELDERFAWLHKALKAIETLGEASPRSRDLVLAQGELLSSRIVAELFRARSGHDTYLFAAQAIGTEARHGSAPIDWRRTRELAGGIRARLEDTGLLVVSGFVGATAQGEITTLGRGGSDYTASVLAACLGADRLEFWKDVDGLLTADPRLVGEARLVPELSYAEAAELCYFGAKILHPETIRPAVENGIPIEIRNSRRGRAFEGTRILPSSRAPLGLKSFTLKRGVTALNLSSTRMLGAAGFLKSVFDVFARLEIPVDLISTSEVSVSLTLEKSPTPDQLERLVAELSHFATVTVTPSRAVLSCVGEGLRHAPGVAARVLQALGDINLHMISQGASELNLGLVLDDARGAEALQRLHSSFFGGPGPAP